MSDSGKAVFLSYASQDSEAAHKICEALRSSGVEVWFDAEGGLEHGDEWDVKIRRQIKECVLFIPLISANTQAREEGYFRIEWDLAAERARGIASGVAFILPVVVDDTREPDALVPDRFRAVQWTKLRGGELTPEVKQRFLKLWSHRTGVVKHQENVGRGLRTPPTDEAGFGNPALQGSSRAMIGGPGWKTYAGLAAGILLVITLLAWWFGRGGAAKPAASVPVAASPAAVAEFPRDPELKRAQSLIYGIENIPEDFALAEDIVKPLLAARPNDPEVVIVAAEISQEFVTRGYDTSDARRTLGQRLTERAVQLAPDNPAALAALGRYLLFINAQLARAEQLLRRAIEFEPNEPRYHRTLFSILAATKPAAEVDAFGERMAARFPRDVLVTYDIARRYKDANNVEAMEEWIDRTLALSPMTAALVWKAWLLSEVHGDVAGMKATLDRIPERQRLVPRVVAAFAVCAGITGDTKTATQLLNALGSTWLSDFDFTGPKALLIGDLLRQAGSEELAHLQYETALAEIQRAEALEPTNPRLLRAEMWTQLGLGNHEKAVAALRLVVQSQAQRGFAGWNLNYSWWNGAIRAAFLLGERDQAMALLRSAATNPTARLLLRNQIHIDPRMAPFRDDPEIVALLAEPVALAFKSGSSSAKATEDSFGTAIRPNEKSVAVLAFANLSEDKNNEYFSDGISEELLNVLAKVPGLKVSARTSAFYFKGKEVPIPEIARQLGVAYVVEGSVRKSGDKVRITAQLIKAADGFHVWSDTFTRDLKDIFAVQDEIAGLIAQQLQVKMLATAAVRPVDPEAHRLVLEGRHFWNLRTIEGFDRAESAFRRALELDPTLAPAHAGLALVLATRIAYKAYSGETTNSGALVRAAAQSALDLDPASVEARAAIAYSYFSESRLAESEQEYRQALALNPNAALLHHWYSLTLEIGGRLDEALAEVTRATELDPLSGIALITRERHAMYAGRYSEALAMHDRAVGLLPDLSAAIGIRAICFLQLGRNEEAVAAAHELSPQSSLTRRIMADAEIVHVLRRTGHQAEAEAHAAAIVPRFLPDSYQRGAVLAALGRFEEGVPFLERTPPTVRYIFLWDPVWDAYRGKPEFAGLIAKLGYEEQYRTARATLAKLQRDSAAK